jgi:hypothetical protein
MMNSCTGNTKSNSKLLLKSDELIIKSRKLKYLFTSSPAPLFQVTTMNLQSLKQ